MKLFLLILTVSISIVINCRNLKFKVIIVLLATPSKVLR